MVQELQNVRCWLLNSQKISVPDDWLEACIEWIHSESQVTSSRLDRSDASNNRKACNACNASMYFKARFLKQKCENWHYIRSARPLHCRDKSSLKTGPGGAHKNCPRYHCNCSTCLCLLPSCHVSGRVLWYVRFQKSQLLYPNLISDQTLGVFL